MKQMIRFLMTLAYLVGTLVTAQNPISNIDNGSEIVLSGDVSSVVFTQTDKGPQLGLHNDSGSQGGGDTTLQVGNHIFNSFLNYEGRDALPAGSQRVGPYVIVVGRTVFGITLSNILRVFDTRDQSLVYEILIEDVELGSQVIGLSCDSINKITVMFQGIQQAESEVIVNGQDINFNFPADGTFLVELNLGDINNPVITQSAIVDGNISRNSLITTDNYVFYAIKSDTDEITVKALSRNNFNELAELVVPYTGIDATLQNNMITALEDGGTQTSLFIFGNELTEYTFQGSAFTLDTTHDGGLLWELFAPNGTSANGRERNLYAIRFDDEFIYFLQSGANDRKDLNILLVLNRDTGIMFTQSHMFFTSPGTDDFVAGLNLRSIAPTQVGDYTWRYGGFYSQTSASAELAGVSISDLEFDEAAAISFNYDISEYPFDFELTLPDDPAVEPVLLSPGRWAVNPNLLSNPASTRVEVSGLPDGINGNGTYDLDLRQGSPRATFSIWTDAVGQSFNALRHTFVLSFEGNTNLSTDEFNIHEGDMRVVVSGERKAIIDLGKSTTQYLDIMVYGTNGAMLINNKHVHVRGSRAYFNVNTLPTGIYFVTTKDDKGLIGKTKFMIQ